MRLVLIVLVLIVVGSLVGWISFRRDADHASINLETNAIRQDTSKVMQSGAELLHRAGDKMEDESVNQQKQAPVTRREPAPVTR
ncbi:MAG: hypothetical protein U0805_02315 [Pirellulales bacterium]